MPTEKKPTRSKKSEEAIVPAVSVEPAIPVEPVAHVPVEPVAPAPIALAAPVAGTDVPGSAKPGQVQAIAIMTLVNGILNVLWGGTATLAMVPGVVTLCLTPLTILPLVLGIFEIIYAAKLLANPPQAVQPSQTLAILEICCILVGNVVSLVVGILALVFYSDPAVKAFFAKLNAQG